jgi:AcrR family transcriptional regulator
MSDVKMDKRPYHSPLRQEQALATRQRILDAALELFARQGYGATSIASIAREAGVVPETIYATFGSKRGIIEGLIERAAPPSIVSGLDAEWEARTGDPAAQLELVADVATAFWSQNDTLATVLRQGTGDTEIADEWASRQKGRRELFGHQLGKWPDATFRAGLDREHAIDLVWVLSTDEIFHLLVRDRGWTPKAYRAWLVGTLRREILGEPG